MLGMILAAGTGLLLFIYISILYLPIIAMSKSEFSEENIYSKKMGITLQIDKDADVSVLRAAFDKINIQK